MEENENNQVKIRKLGDTTIVTQHCDPYSFYWQLDKLQPADKEPKKKCIAKEKIYQINEPNKVYFF